MATVSTFLWFPEGAEDALSLYARVVPGASITAWQREGDEGPFMMGSLHAPGIDLVCFNGGPLEGHSFNPAFSLVVTCVDQAEVDAVWEGLVEGGREVACGWLTDRFGVSWQIVPQLFFDLMGAEDREAAGRVFAAMRTMVKFDCSALQAAFDA